MKQYSKPLGTPNSTGRISRSKKAKWVSFVAFSFAAFTGSLANAQDLNLSFELEETAPLILDDASYPVPNQNVPGKLQVTEVSSTIPAPASPFVLPTAKPGWMVDVPMVPSVVKEYTKLQEESAAEDQEPSTAPVEVDQLMDDLVSDLDDSAADTDIQVSPNEKWRLRTIEDVDFNHRADGEIPADRSAELLSSVANQGNQPFVGTTAYWVAPNLYYQPLLFEDPLLERYGRGSQVWGVQPAKSGVHFAVDSFMMPFRAFKYRCEIQTPLAFERPGTCNMPTKEIVMPLN